VIAPLLAAALSTVSLAATAPAPLSTQVHSYTGAVPVLCYHGIHDNPRPASDPYAISPAEFGRQMAMLAADGFHTVSIAQYARFAAGDTAGLPDRPLLVTFDDGRIDSFQRADPVLARYGMRATMFVIAANAAVPKAGYLGWPKLAAMAAGGRWDVQEHAYAGHVTIPTGPGGQTGPFYANLLYRNGARERFTAFKRRVSGDVLAGRRLMEAKIPGYRPLAFAVPYGNYGQGRSNYGPIAAWESGWLRQTFGVFFVQDRRAYNLPGTPLGQRYGVHAGTTAAALHQWLAQALPRAVWKLPPAVLTPSAAPARPHRPVLRSVHRGVRTILLRLRSRGAARLSVTRRRAGMRAVHRLRPSRTGRVRDRRLRPATTYVYRAQAVDAAGAHSRPLTVRVRTRRVLQRG
jgi:hypothetical protein